MVRLLKYNCLGLLLSGAAAALSSVLTWPGAGREGEIYKKRGADVMTFPVKKGDLGPHHTIVTMLAQSLLNKSEVVLPGVCR